MANPAVSEMEDAFQDLIAKEPTEPTAATIADILTVLKSQTRKSFSQQQVANAIETYRTSSSPKFDVQPSSGFWIISEV